ncbi:MAG: hypothetical protein C0394_05260 [Syntrophus sp. (in: bacteria)]|nr:hypothetical protein [Syntrophus sp. (in: bacteria)]
MIVLFLFRSWLLWLQNAARGLLDSLQEILTPRRTSCPFMQTKAPYLFSGDMLPKKTLQVIHHLQ